MKFGQIQTISLSLVLVVSIMEPFPRVLEGQGLLEVSLVKSEGAVGPVRVRLFTRDDTATGRLLLLQCHYEVVEWYYLVPACVSSLPSLPSYTLTYA